MQCLASPYQPEEVVPAGLLLGREAVAQLADQLGQVVLGADAPRATRGQHHGWAGGGVTVGVGRKPRSEEREGGLERVKKLIDIFS